MVTAINATTISSPWKKNENLFFQMPGKCTVYGRKYVRKHGSKYDRKYGREIRMQHGRKYLGNRAEIQQEVRQEIRLKIRSNSTVGNMQQL